MKILQYIRLYIENGITQIAHLTPFTFCNMRSLDIRNVVYKHTETTEYVKK